MLLHRHPQVEMQGAPRFGQLQHHLRATPLPEQLFAERPAAAADRLHGEDEARLRQQVAVAATTLGQSPEAFQRCEDAEIGCSYGCSCKMGKDAVGCSRGAKMLEDARQIF